MTLWLPKNFGYGIINSDHGLTKGGCGLIFFGYGLALDRRGCCLGTSLALDTGSFKPVTR